LGRKIWWIFIKEGHLPLPLSFLVALQCIGMGGDPLLGQGQPLWVHPHLYDLKLSWGKRLYYIVKSDEPHTVNLSPDRRTNFQPGPILLLCTVHVNPTKIGS
jgi:hypothetical protein